MTREELIVSPDWHGAHARYYGRITFADAGEQVERDGAARHRLGARLPHLQAFWRCHVAPATGRPADHWLVPGVDPAVTRMAERSYEVFCAFVDALDALDEVRAGALHPPRYRHCLNVLRHAGDAMQLFTSLCHAIEAEGREVAVVGGVHVGLATSLGARIRLFPDFDRAWRAPYREAIRYRNMLAHEGRPWFYFDGPDFGSVPFLLRDDRRAQDHGHESRAENNRAFRDPAQRHRFIALPDACAATVESCLGWVDRGYGRILDTLEPFLTDPASFARYRRLWAWPPAPAG